MRTRFVLSFALAIAVVVGAGACSKQDSAIHYSGDFPVYGEIEALWQEVDLVVEVVAGEPSVERLNTAVPLPGRELPPEEAEGDVFTVYQAEVVHAWKGEVEVGETVEVKQLGGEHDGVTHALEGQSMLVPGETYLLFLVTFPDFPGRMPASLANPWQGQYRLGPAGEPVALSGNDLMLTRNDLDELQTGN